MNKLISTIISTLLLVLATAVATSCSDDLYPDLQSPEAVKGLAVDDIDSWGGYVYFTVERTDDAAGTPLRLSTDSPWLALTVDILPEDGIVEIFAQANPEAEGRYAVIEIAADAADGASEAPRSLVTVRQKGLADYDSNDVAPIYQDFRVGWGYNAFAEYESARSVLRPVIDVSAMSAEDSDDTFQSVQEGTDFKEEFDIQCAYSLQELTSILTEKMDRTVKFLGMRKTTSRYSKITTKNLNEQCFSYTRLTKRVLRRSIDEGALQYLVMQGRPPLTEDFRAAYNTIMNTSNSTERDRAIRTMLQTFGTHIVTEASLGGAIDYVATYDRSQVSNLTEVTESHSSKIFGRKSSGESHSSSEHVTSTISADQTFGIYGGDPALITQIKDDIRRLSNAGTLNPDLLSKWEASIAAGSDAQKKNLDLVDFRLYPIWELFTDDDVIARIQQIVLDMNQQSNNTLTDREVGLDNYYIYVSDLNRNPDIDFPVTLYYQGNKPVLQVCTEYVPKIRGDRPITVFYPIVGGKVRISQGLFAGDGEGNPPSYLCFSDGDVYVQPVKGMTGKDVVSTLYLLGGNLYAENYNTPCKSIGYLFKEQEFFRMFTDYTDRNHKPCEMSCGVVKIGSGYWMEESVNAPLGYLLFEGVEAENGTFYMALNPVTEMGPVPSIKTEHPEQDEGFRKYLDESSRFGPDEDENNNNKCWYLPKKSDYENLMKYLGNNTKSLFRGQPSGFNAIFNGCYIGEEYLDGHGQTPSAANKVYYNGERSYLLTYDPGSLSCQFNVLLLTKDYKWKINPDPENPADSPEEWDAGIYWLDHLFPVRLFHDQGYVYPDI